MSRLSNNPIERKTLREIIKVLARQEKTAKDKIELIAEIIDDVHREEVKRRVREKMAEESL